MSPSAFSEPPPAPNGPQLYRLQHLLEWLRHGRVLTTRIAADRLQVSRRTIHSDLDYLRMVGVPLAWNAAEGTYELTDDFDNLPIASLRRRDWAALLVAQHALQALGDGPHAEVLERTVERLAACLPDEVQLDPADVAASLRMGAGPRAKRDTARQQKAVQDAVRDGCLLRMRYYSAHGDEETERTVRPLALVEHDGHWYAVAYCHLREDYRDFRLDRIRRLTPLDTYEAAPADFDLDAYLKRAFGMHRGEKKHAVRIRFSSYQARWIREDEWHDTQLLLKRDDGSLELMMEVAGLDDLARWVMQYGPEAEVLAPPALRQRVAEAHRAAARLYEDNAKSPDA